MITFIIDLAVLIITRCKNLKYSSHSDLICTVDIDGTSLLSALAVSMKIRTDGLHKLEEFGNFQPRARVSNWWAGSGTQRCSFTILSELPAFKNWEISHFQKSRFSASLEISEDLATLSPHSYLVTLGWSQIAAVSVDGTWTLKFASLHHSVISLTLRTRAVAIIWMFYSFIRKTCLAVTGLQT